MRRILPSDSLMGFSFCVVKYRLPRPSPEPPEVGLRARNILQNLCFERFRTLKFPFVAQTPEELHADTTRSLARRRIEQKCFDRHPVVTAERRPVAHIGDRYPTVPTVEIAGARDINAGLGRSEERR